MKDLFKGNAISVLSGPLENNFAVDDGLSSFELQRGRGDDAIFAGIFKGQVRVSRVGVDDKISPFPVLPSPAPCTCIVRVYVVRGIDLAAKDSNGRSDPYVTIHVGKRRVVRDRIRTGNVRGFQAGQSLPLGALRRCLKSLSKRHGQ